ncbi:MAG: dephospho-CoA kinase [Ruminococcaceae bacterium]|nr:dephospho-CoA kinase [Oscillospiraceae bacterium]
MALKIIGLTGPSGSGKSLFCKLLSDRGAKTIDADKVYHSLLVPPSPCLDKLEKRFGSGIIRADGTLDREVLASIVFASGAEGELEALNEITLGTVIEKIKSMISELDPVTPAVVVDAPTLFESGFDRDCDLTVALIADRETRLMRIIERDGIERSKAEARINAQKNDEFYLENCDIVIYNDENIGNLDAAAKKVLSEVIKC